MGTISWEEFVIGVRHILSVSGTIGDGWYFRGSLEETLGGYLAKRLNYPVAIAEPTAASQATRLQDDDAVTIDHDPSEQDLCSIDPDPSFRPVCREFHVLYSLAHAVPTFYWRAWRSDGSCVEAEELWNDFTSAEWRPSSDEYERLRSLTQQEHPFLGEPWYHLHPCRTADLMNLVESNDVNGIDAKRYFVRWMSTVAPLVGCPVSHHYASIGLTTLQTTIEKITPHVGIGIVYSYQDQRLAQPRSRDDVYSCVARSSEMELVRAFTTRQPVVGTTGTTLQRNITIYVLVAGIVGGLVLILIILFLCKYCSRLRSRNNRERNTTNPAVSGWGTEVSVALTSSGVGKAQHRLTGNNNNKLTTSSTSTGSILVTTLSQPVIPLSALTSPSAGHQHIGIGTNPSIIKDHLSDSSYVIQIEPNNRIMSASPSSILGGTDSWVSDESPTTHRGLLPVSEERDEWTRCEYHKNVDHSIVVGDDDNIAVSAVIPAPNDSHRRSLLHHAATHDDGSATSSAVSKRRLDWRNSHRNYRSAPTAAADIRDSYALNYDTRWALRDYHQRSVEAGSVYSSPRSNRRVLHKRGGSMRETLTDDLETLSSCSSTATELGGNNLPSTSAAQQPHSRCQIIASQATKRWRCLTVDCPCSNNVTAASPVNKDLILLDGAHLTIHRHSFPSSGELSSPSSSNRRRHYHQHRGQDQHEYFGPTKESLYDGYLINRSESLDWEGFETRAKTTSAKRDDAQSVMVDVDGTSGQLQTASAGPAPRVTIRYNDPGSPESINEDNLFFCLEAGSKKEFRQRLEKTIDAQYRQVWELRANLEEHNECYQPSSPEPETIINPGLAISDVESFDSNSESIVSEEEDIRTRNNYDMIVPAQDLPAACELTTTSSANMLIATTSSGSWKRQSYRSVSMNSRFPNQSGQIIPTQRSPHHQPQSSFDSIDTIETSSTEASRMDHVTTSFESSATDSTNGLEVTSIPPSVSHHRMLALRNDSGYRSLESAIVPSSGLTKTPIKGRTMSLSEDDFNDPLTQQEVNCQCRSQVLHDEKCERYKPIVFARCTRYGMKVRSASTSAPHPLAPPTGWKHQQRLHQHHSQQSLTRDYSIDERTDALFREFSRCDPVFNSSTAAKNIGGGSRTELRTTGFSHRNRWINQRYDAQHHYQHRFMSSDASDSLLQHCSLKE